MQFKKKLFKIVFLGFLVFIVAGFIVSQQKEDERTAINYNKKNELVAKPVEIIPIPKTSGNWVLTNITIDDKAPYGAGSMTWAVASTKTWCKGSGKAGDPYHIENVTIEGKYLRSCINITDSKAYFKINNCTVYNSPSEGNYAGIYLNNVMNGTLTGNNCSFNKNYGIYLNGCSNITITNNNIIKNNTIYGILLNISSGNEISNNTISFCKSGIHIEPQSGSNNISGNIIYNASLNGIFLNSVGSNNVSDNIIFNSSGNGIGLLDITNTYVENNIIHDIKGNGIELLGSIDAEIHHIDIKNNKVYDNGGCGIKMEGEILTTNIINNRIYNNTETGIYINESDYFTIQQLLIKNNEIINNGYFGVYIYKGNTIDIIGNLVSYNGYNDGYQKGGICADSYDKECYFKQNTISNNNLCGINITISSWGNIVYNNTFLNQNSKQIFHAIDSTGHGSWDYNNLGNYWDDYWGRDFNDDGIGDVVYYLLGGIDHYPIWWDAPVISNIKPVQGTEYSITAPDYQVQVDEGRGDFFWYEILGTGKNMSITDLFGSIREKTSGTINQTLWDGLSQGTITIRFYANDSRGYITHIDVQITKRIPISPVIIIEGDDDDDGSVEKEDPYVWLIRTVIGGAISACVGIVIKQSYSSVKKNRQLYELISKKFDEIEQLEQFLMKNLGKVDWENFKTTYKEYANRKISQKELIKEGKKSMGKSFIELFVPKPKRKFAR